MGSKSPLLPLIADCERGLGRPERAKQDLGRALELEPGFAEAAEQLKKLQ